MNFLLLFSLGFNYCSSVLLTTLLSFSPDASNDRVPLSTPRLPSPLAYSLEYGFWIFVFQIISFLMALGGLVSQLTADNLSRLLLVASFLMSGYIYKMGHSPVRLGCQYIRALVKRCQTLLSTSIGVVGAFLLICMISFSFAEIVHSPPITYDVFTHHLPPVKVWNDSQSLLTRLEFSDSARFDMGNQNFMGLSLLNLVSLWSFGSQTLIELPSLLFGIVLLLTIYRTLRYLGVDEGKALLYSALIFASPIMLFHIQNCKDYICYTSCWLSFVVSLAMYFDSEKKPFLLLSVIPGGLSVGFKIVCSFTVPATLAVFFVLIACKDRFVRNSESRKLSNADSGKLICGLIIVALLVSWVWIYKNYRDYGSYYPRFFTNKTGEYLSLTDIKDDGSYKLKPTTTADLPFAKNLGLLWKNITRYPQRVLDFPFLSIGNLADDHYVYVHNGLGVSNFGFLYFSLGQLFFLVSLYRAMKSPKEHKVALFLATIAVLILGMHWGVYYNFFSYRSHMFFYLIVMIVALKGFDDINSNIQPFWLISLGIFSVFLQLCFVSAGNQEMVSPLSISEQKPFSQRGSGTFVKSASRVYLADTILPQDFSLLVNLSPPDLYPLYGYALTRRLTEIKFTDLMTPKTLWERGTDQHVDGFFISVTSGSLQMVHDRKVLEEYLGEPLREKSESLEKRIAGRVPWILSRLPGGRPHLWVSNKHALSDSPD